MSTDTNGITYIGARYTPHYALTLNDTNYICTYALTNNYSICEGQIVWSQHSKNIEGSAWIDFYQGNELVYRTDEINNSGNVVSFSFSVKDLAELTIVKNSTISHERNYSAYIIYPYLNFVE